MSETRQTQTITHRHTGAVIYSVEAETILKAIERAVLTGANLYGANLTRANLYGANLSRANLYGANLYGADLSRANVTGADLYGADLSRANLSRANLSRANLTGADLSRADLTRADLYGADLSRADVTGADLYGAELSRADVTGANLYGANLYGANLYGADLTYDQLIMAKLELIKMDFWGRLCCFPAEVDALRVALIDGRVNGSCYEGECSCFIGTVAKARGIKYDAMPELKPDGNSATERWFLAIETGDKIETNPIVRITVEWIDEWDARMGSEVKA